MYTVDLVILFYLIRDLSIDGLVDNHAEISLLFCRGR